MTEQTKFVLTEDAHPHALGQPAAGPPGRPAAAAQPGHDAAGRAGRPHADLPDGDHRPGGVAGAGGRDPGAGARRLPAVAARRRSSARTGSSASSIRPRTSTTSTRASRRPARTSRTARSRRRTPTRRPACERLVDRDRRRPVGLGARARLQPVRARVRRVHGRRELRPEAVPARDDGELGRDRDPLAERHDRGRARARPSTPRARSASRSPRRWRWPPGTRARTTRSARC